MKKYIAITALIFSVNNLFAQLDMYVQFSKNAVGFDMNYFGEKKISDKFSINYFGLMEKTWSEALVGGTYSPTQSLSFTAMTGIEHGSKSPRYFAGVWTGKGKTSLLSMFEKGKGKDNYWYRVNLYQQVSENVTAGLVAWRYNGTGPIFRYTVKKLAGSTLWMMPAYDFESHGAKLMTGVTIKF